MSSFKASVVNPRLTGALRRSCYAIGLSLALSTLSTQAFAACQYTVTGQWSNGFTGSVKITNDTATATNGWSLSWQYTGDNRISGSYDVSMSGTNPYTAKNAGWNGTIQPNQSVTFGFQGSKGAAAAEVPVLTGALCGNATSSAVSSSRSSVASSIAPSSIASSSIAPGSSSRSSLVSSSAPSSRSSLSSSSVVSSVDGGGWSLNSTDSYLNFVTTKNTHNVEAHNFTVLSGEINPAGIATLRIDLNSVNTGVALRDQRMRDLLFETLTYPTATVTMSVPASVIGGLAVGQSSQNDITASLNLHGVTANVTTRVLVQKLSSSRVLVQSLAPVLTKADTYSLVNGVEALRAAVGIASINASVPVDFALVFDAR
ncbi:MAG TPA: carbohydrate-binding protein [Cellvibrio sp.]|nr:carbohydrate-binding protein [Cellvibrio sp.]